MHYSYMVIDHSAGSRSSAPARAPLPGSPTARRHAGGAPPRRRRAVLRRATPAHAEVPADRVRLARRRARGHWQIVKHRPDGSPREGGFPPFELAKAPPALIDIAVRAARPSGEGFYGVDVKETVRGFIAWRSTTTPTSSTASRTRPARTRSGSECSSGSSSASSNSLRCRLRNITGRWPIGLRKLPLRALHRHQRAP